MTLITTINEYKQYLLENNNITPIRFRDSSLTDIIDFVEEILYQPSKIDITEKIAGQHLTVNIQNGHVTVNNKDSLLQNTGSLDASRTRYGADVTRPLITYLQSNSLNDQTWAFEIVHPKYNHDYIKYQNTDIIYVEYTGTLTDNVADEIRKNMRSGTKLLTKKDIKINVNKNQAYNDFKKLWESGLGRKFKTMNSNNKGRYYRSNVNQLKFTIGKLLEDILVSVVDKVSPIEGVVAGTNTPIKLQTNSFLDVQRIQMSMFSVFKINRNEYQYVLDNPTTSFNDLKTQFNIELSSIYKGDLNRSLFDMVKRYLEENSKLDHIDTSKYKRWLTTQESDNYLNQLTQSNVVQIYKDIYSKVI